MSIPLLCLLIAGVLPYVAVGFAKAGGGYDNHDPRASMSKVTGMRARAYAAHQNCFEAFPFFAAGVLAALWSEADGGLINALCLIFVAARVLYIAAYLSDRATLRSIVWMFGLFATIGLFTVAV